MAKPYMPPMERNRMQSSAAPGQLEGGYNDDSAPETPPEHMEEDEEPMSEGKTANIPIDLLGGKDFKAGEEIVFKIVKVDPENKTVEIEYAPEKGKDEEEEMMPREAAGGESEGMDQGGKMMGDGSEY
jgi:hypothetical protein